MRVNLNNLKATIVAFENKFSALKNRNSNQSPYTYNGTSVKPKFSIRFVLLVLSFFVILTGVFVIASNFRKTSARINQVVIASPIATETLNKEFNFSLTDASGKQVSTIKYIIQSAELRNEIVVKGQTATAVAGKEFLVINLKIVNDQNLGVQINTKDYIRLSVNGNTNEWLAPDIHNDPVDVQAISTKFTRVGYAINKSDKNLVLRVGEINGPKQDISLNVNAQGR